MRLRVRLRKNEKQMERKRKASEMDFASLIQAIRTTHEHFAAQAVRAVNIGLTLRNWFIGAHIAEFELRGADRAHYGDRLLDELSHELRKADISNTGRRQLYQYLAFFRTYPQIARTVPAQSRMLLPEATGLQKKVRTASAQSAIPPETLMNQLSYSHFELLIGLDDDLKRRFYEVGSIRGQWSVRELKGQIAPLYLERPALSETRKGWPQLFRAVWKSNPRCCPSDILMSSNFLASSPARSWANPTWKTPCSTKCRSFCWSWGGASASRPGRSASGSAMSSSSWTSSSTTASSSATS